jgi:hypothetical protein
MRAHIHLNERDGRRQLADLPLWPTIKRLCPPSSTSNVRSCTKGTPRGVRISTLEKQIFTQQGGVSH